MPSLAIRPRIAMQTLVRAGTSARRVARGRSMPRGGVSTARRPSVRRAMSTRCETVVGTAADDRASVRASRAARDDSGERYVYVGNLDFFDDPADVRRYLAAALARATPACPVPASIAVPGWGSGPRVDQRKRRDEGKLNRGFAVLEFADADAGRAAAAALDGAVVNGRALRSSPGVTVKKDDGGDPSDDDDGGGGGEDEAAARARAERRAHNRRQRRRRKQRDAAALGERLERLMRTHPLWVTDDCAATGRARRSVAADSLDDDTWRDGWWDDDTWREGWGSLYSVWASKDDATGLGFVDWAKCPPAADPAGSNKRGGAARGTRKRLQVESFRAVVSAAATTLGLGPGGSKRRPTIVDFGCGTGNLLLPLAAQHPEADFVGLDLNPRSIDLLSARARDAGLANVAARVGLIEEYEGPCDLALALHVCGSGTDAVLLQAQARGAAFVVAPCCIGKLRDGGLKSVAGMKNAISTADGDGDGDGDGKGTTSWWSGPGAGCRL